MLARERHEVRRPAIFPHLRTLPDQLAREVLDFAVYLRDRRAGGDWRDLMEAQSASLAPIWDNVEDKVWDDV